MPIPRFGACCCDGICEGADFTRSECETGCNEDWAWYVGSECITNLCNDTGGDGSDPPDPIITLGWEVDAANSLRLNLNMEIEIATGAFITSTGWNFQDGGPLYNYSGQGVPPNGNENYGHHVFPDYGAYNIFVEVLDSNDNQGTWEGIVTLSIPTVYGCTDDDACNPDPDATDDDGSCWYVGPDPCSCPDGPDCYIGCLDDNAINYDPDAYYHNNELCEYGNAPPVAVIDIVIS
tara:strand:- start:542 stop:1246 length:705 start_codon:yes stop_codon:yes gene_type:complete